MVSNEAFASGYKVNNTTNVSNASNVGAGVAGSVSSVNSAGGLGSRSGGYRHNTNESSASRGTAGRNAATRGNPNEGKPSQGDPTPGNTKEDGPNMGSANLSTPTQGGPPLNGEIAAPPNSVEQGIEQGSGAAGGGSASPQHEGTSSSQSAVPPTSNAQNVKNSNTTNAISSTTGAVGSTAQQSENVPNETNNGNGNANGNANTGTSSSHANNPTNPRNTPPADDEEKRKIYQLVFDLCYSDKRESALLELSRKRETYQDIAPVLWNSFGTITTLLQEIVSIYPQLSPPLLTTSSSNRVCNSLALLQCVASHPETKQHFLNAHIPLFLYPFLNAESKNRPFEYLRLTSLGVIGALVKVDNPDVINFLLQTEIIPLCLRIMETGSELSKTVATFIVQKILIDELGLNYICATPVRFYAVSTVLANMVNALIENPSSRLLKHIVRCYLRLSENPKALKALRECLPDSLRHVHKAFIPCLKEDPYTKKWLLQLLYNINNEDGPHGHVGSNVGSNAGSHVGSHAGGYAAPTHSGGHSGVSGGHPTGRQGLHAAGSSKSTYAGVTIPANMSEDSSAGQVSGGHGSGSHVGGANPNVGLIPSSSSNSVKDKVNVGSASNPNVSSKSDTVKAMENANAAPSSVPPSSNATNNANGADSATNNTNNSDGTNGPGTQEGKNDESANSAEKTGSNGNSTNNNENNAAN
ncbi:Cell differentiation protein rcd1 [Plasmodium coatneyi]|uniref:Cell differentiation protein rcd1 n=1 Tax=Plasmodium coatneyi TaxID=208452 RepID=A0A1B1E0Q1_9APIC|nr:Cell differentiation protein rcd1 [Plasmodium coatneyi]ANQ08598.1 Cell differentiation protein rcd1 [Plasmodium coatneyi]